MMLRLVLQGNDPYYQPEDDLTSDHLPLVGDEIVVESERREEIRRYRVTKRIFRTIIKSAGNSTLKEESFSGVVLEVMQIGPIDLDALIA